MGPITIAGMVFLASLSSAVPPKMSRDPAFQRVATCFLKGEQTSNMNKICFYDCLGSAAAITVSAYSLCPLSMER